MTDTGRRNFSSRLQHGGGKFSSRDEVDVIPDLFAHETTKQEKLARGSCSGWEGMPVPRKRRRRRGLGRGDTWSRKGDWRIQVEFALRPRVGWLARLLLLLRASGDRTGASGLLLWLWRLHGAHSLRGIRVIRS